MIISFIQPFTNKAGHQLLSLKFKGEDTQGNLLSASAVVKANTENIDLAISCQESEKGFALKSITDKTYTSAQGLIYKVAIVDTESLIEAGFEIETYRDYLVGQLFNK